MTFIPFTGCFMTLTFCFMTLTLIHVHLLQKPRLGRRIACQFLLASRWCT